MFLFSELLVLTRPVTRNDRSCFQVYRQPIPVRDLALEDLQDGEIRMGGSFRGAFTNGEKGRLRITPPAGPVLHLTDGSSVVDAEFFSESYSCVSLFSKKCFPCELCGSVPRPVTHPACQRYLPQAAVAQLPARRSGSAETPGSSGRSAAGRRPSRAPLLCCFTLDPRRRDRREPSAGVSPKTTAADALENQTRSETTRLSEAKGDRSVKVEGNTNHYECF